MTDIDAYEALDVLRAKGSVARIPVPDAVRDGSPPRIDTPRTLELIGPVPLPIDLEGQHLEARWYVAAPTARHREAAHLADHTSILVFGEPTASVARPLVRVHSTCLTGDVLGSLRCDCGPQLASAMRSMSTCSGGGILVYMSAHEGRGIGLWSKAAAYLIQDDGLDTYAANRALGRDDDERSYGYAAAILRHLLGDHAFRLLTNNPDKVQQLRELGLRNFTREPIVIDAGAHNHRYLDAKRSHGHAIPRRAEG